MKIKMILIMFIIILTSNIAFGKEDKKNIEVIKEGICDYHCGKIFDYSIISLGYIPLVMINPIDKNMSKAETSKEISFFNFTFCRLLYWGKSIENPDSFLDFSIIGGATNYKADSTRGYYGISGTLKWGNANIVVGAVGTRYHTENKGRVLRVVYVVGTDVAKYLEKYGILSSDSSKK
jgi:hypothetical protein